MPNKKDEHFDLGVYHSAAGIPRYKFQDPTLQERYDRGYDLGLSSDEGPKAHVDPILAHWRSLRGGKWA